MATRILIAFMLAVFSLVAFLVWAPWRRVSPTSLPHINPPPSMSLNIVYERQLGNNTCWAASAVMILKALGENKSQCEVAGLGVGRTDCCSGTTGVLGACNVVGWPPFAAAGFQCRKTTKLALTLAQLKQEIGISQRPVATTWEVTNSGGGRSGLGHMVVTGGYRSDASGDTVEIWDPLCDEDEDLINPAQPCGYRIIPYSDYVSGALLNGTTYLHWDDFYEIRR